MILCSSPFGFFRKRKRRNKLQTSLVASSSSTVAEEIVVLLRRLHPLPAWNKIINKFIGNNLQSIPFLVIQSEKSSEALSKEDQVRNCQTQ